MANPFEAFLALFTGGNKGTQTKAMPKGPVIKEPPNTFAEDLSAWPAILDIKESLEEMSPEEQRRQKLEGAREYPARHAQRDGIIRPRVVERHLASMPLPRIITLTTSSHIPQRSFSLSCARAVGTNWPPRTTTVMNGERTGPLAFFDFDDTGREGYMFFQGPTPLTGVQPDLAPLLSKEDLALAQPSPKLFVFGGIFSGSFAYILYLLITG